MKKLIVKQVPLGPLGTRAVASLAHANYSTAYALHYYILRYRHEELSDDLCRRLTSVKSLSAKDYLAPIIDGMSQGAGQASLLESVTRLADAASGWDRPLGVRCYQYVRAMMQGEFTEAYAHWTVIRQDHQGMSASLTELEASRRGAVHGRVALVLPGPSQDGLGKEIDAHDLVARTTIEYPGGDRAMDVGSRCDYVFMNQSRFSAIASSGDLPIGITIVSSDPTSTQKVGWPEGVRVYSLPPLSGIISNTTYIGVRACDWLLRRGFGRISVYNADFYLGTATYSSSSYGSDFALQEADQIRRSYLLHDVFSAHYFLSELSSCGMIRPTGSLLDILALSGEEFASLIEEKWGSGILGGYS